MHWTLRANVGAMALVTTIGTIDAVVSQRWDLAVLAPGVGVGVVAVGSLLPAGRR